MQMYVNWFLQIIKTLSAVDPIQKMQKYVFNHNCMHGCIKENLKF